MADTEYTDREALNDGVLVNLLAEGVRVHFNGRPITRATKNLLDTLGHYNPGGSIAEQAAAYTALLGFAVAGARDEAGPGEPRDYLWNTPPHKALRDRPIWLQPNDDGYVAMLPEDY